MRRVCEASGSAFEVDKRDLAFYERVSPIVGGTKLLIPPPRLAPEERQRRRIAFRNERYLYRNQCCLTGKALVSPYSPDKKLKVVDRVRWLELDNTQFGRSVDFNRPFFQQFAELFSDTYKAHVNQAGEMVNSEYAHFCGWLKDCYMVFDMGKSEDCMHGVFMGYCRTCQDSFFLSRCELCYECIKLEDCYNVRYATYCKTCSDSAFVSNCIGCSNCLFCSNLRNKSYCIDNRHVGRERFQEEWKKLFSGSYSTLERAKARYHEMLLKAPQKALNNVNCEDSTGDDLTRCQNALDCYNSIEIKDCRYCHDMYLKTNDCYDIGTFGEGMQYCYEVTASGAALGKSEVSNIFFSSGIYYGGYNILYSINCHENSSNLFGCCDLRKAQYCILNKRYSKEEYESLVPRIVELMRSSGEWGEFFPISLSPFGYNESLAMEFYPLQREDVTRLGGSWSDYSPANPEVKKSLTSAQLQDSISAYGDDVLETAIICETSGKPFRLARRELALYRQQGLPIPRRHPEVRHRDRVAFFRPRRLWDRQCGNCKQQVVSSMPPERPEIILCERCYEQATD